MPELPEVEGVVRDLRPIVEGKTIERVTLSETIYASHDAGKQAIVKSAAPQHFEQMIQEMTIDRIERRSKYIFFHITGFFLSLISNTTLAQFPTAGIRALRIGWVGHVIFLCTY